jgi:hypothetical protein
MAGNLNVIDVPLGPATAEYGATTPTIYNVTKGGVNFKANTTKKDVTIDQFGDTPVKSVIKGRTCQATIPMAESDLKKLFVAIPNAKYAEDATDPEAVKKRIDVYANAGYNLMQDADKLVIKPTSDDTTANDYVTIPNAVPLTDVDWTYDADNERIALVTFVGYPDSEGLLYTLGDESVTVPVA